jgi:hypothetical protein
VIAQIHLENLPALFAFRSIGDEAAIPCFCLKTIDTLASFCLFLPPGSLIEGTAWLG